jgi:hypothetical protein
MNLEIGKMIQLDGIECCVLSKQTIENIQYIYVAEMSDDDITDNFYVYRITDKFERVVNSDELKNILPVFIQSMSEDLKGE